ncbi:hypothetical protein NEOLEDRAFT_1152502 [Neolentinus lepideus HHB14362 ss-1]|uniref:Uncharacterized protein n=1 Tax=Neolentinus lepideus HHB14362 ss-1 TaxID=1314782 RepID=A0A165MQW5_9AGAM|nr:hypothetical protein NEOLEDRAFT_1152502 [Neolentinus lepideus HHB14362 ss-1]
MADPINSYPINHFTAADAVRCEQYAQSVFAWLNQTATRPGPPPQGYLSVYHTRNAFAPVPDDFPNVPDVPMVAQFPAPLVPASVASALLHKVTFTQAAFTSLMAQTKELVQTMMTTAVSSAPQPGIQVMPTPPWHGGRGGQGGCGGRGGCSSCGGGRGRGHGQNMGGIGIPHRQRFNNGERPLAVFVTDRLGDEPGGVGPIRCRRPRCTHARTEEMVRAEETAHDTDIPMQEVLAVDEEELPAGDGADNELDEDAEGESWDDERLGPA